MEHKVVMWDWIRECNVRNEMIAPQARVLLPNGVKLHAHVLFQSAMTKTYAGKDFTTAWKRKPSDAREIMIETTIKLNWKV